MKRDFLRIAVYARVSTDKEDQVHSLLSQKTYFEKYIQHQDGWKLSGIYYDEGVSGTQTRKRVGFNQMVRDALSGKFDLIVTKEVSRFARNTVDTLSYTRQLKEAGVGVIFTIDHIDTREQDGELRLTIMASMAQEESRKTSERVKWGQKRRMEQGVVFGRDMLGYSVKHGMLVKNEEEVPIVRTIFHKYTNEGKGMHTIARELREEGICSKRSAWWSDTAIMRVLQNEKYVGDLCQKKTYTPNYLTHEKKYNRGEEEKIYICNHHEAIIDRELWMRTQEELKRRSMTGKRKEKHSNCYWCSGKIYCGKCGSRFVSRTKKLTGGTYRAWRCFQNANHGSFKKDREGKERGCNNNSVNDRVLLACMRYCVSLFCNKKEELKQEILSQINRVCKTEKPAFDKKKLQNKIDTIEIKKRKCLDAMLDGILTKEESRKQSEWYEEEMERLNQILVECEKRETEKKQDREENHHLEKTLDEILGMGEENKRFYREILQRIVIYPEEEKRCSRLVVWLKELPMGIQLKVKSIGKGEGYDVEILETSFVETKGKEY